MKTLLSDEFKIITVYGTEISKDSLNWTMYKGAKVDISVGDDDEEIVTANIVAAQVPVAFEMTDGYMHGRCEAGGWIFVSTDGIVGMCKNNVFIAMVGRPC